MRKNKILIISECYPNKKSPQYGIFIYQQTEAIKSLGFICDVVVPYRNTKNTSLVKMRCPLNEEEYFEFGYHCFRYD